MAWWKTRWDERGQDRGWQACGGREQMTRRPGAVTGETRCDVTAGVGHRCADGCATGGHRPGEGRGTLRAGRAFLPGQEDHVAYRCGLFGADECVQRVSVCVGRWGLLTRLGRGYDNTISKREDKVILGGLSASRRSADGRFGPSRDL